MNAFLSLRAPRTRRWMLGICVAVANLSTAIVAVAQTNVGAVVSILALRGVSSAVYNQISVEGYSVPRDGGGGVYIYHPGDTSAENGGTIIVATDGARWFLTQSEPPSITQFGAVHGSAADNVPAIQSALDACAVVTVPPGVYRCEGPITIHSHNALLGLGSHGQALSVGQTDAAKFIFYNTGEACFVSSDTSNLCYAALKNLAIYVDPSATYHWMMHFTGPIGMEMENIVAQIFYVYGQTGGLATGGIKCNNLSINSNVSTKNHWYNVGINLPSNSMVCADQPAPAACEACQTLVGHPNATMPTLDIDFTDSEIIGGHFTGGTGAFFRGPGGRTLTGVRIDQSVGYNLTIEHDVPGDAQPDGFVNCSFEQCSTGEVLINLDAPEESAAYVYPRFVGNGFWAPGITTPIIVVQHGLTDDAYWGDGGLFTGNIFITNPATVYSMPNGGAGWTIAHNVYATAPDFSAINFATVHEATNVRTPLQGKSVMILGQSGVALDYTGGTSEADLAVIPVPLNLLGTASKLRVSATYSVPANTHSKTVRVRFGSTAFYEKTVSSSADTLIHTICEISMNGANAQVTAHGIADPGPGVTADSVVTGTEPTSGTGYSSVHLTGTLANGFDTVTLEQYTVELIKP